MKCCQTESLHVVEVMNLFHEDLEPLQPDDLVAGSSLMMELDNKMYPGTFVKGNFIHAHSHSASLV